jgi:cytochrome b6-f complex iron-sulfur subunit
MATMSATLNISSATQLASASNGVCSSSRVVAAPQKAVVSKRRVAATVASGAPAYVPDMGRRNTVNLLLLGAVGLPGSLLAGGYAYFFVPPGSGGTGGGVTAKDALGNDVFASKWLAAHPAGDRTLVQGLKGDPTYLVVEGDGTLAGYGVNAVCTHLGCVVPWNAAENKFMCPCHGSQYNNQGKVVRGPAPLSLALAHADVTDDKVILGTWSETDFRTGENPWWS